MSSKPASIISFFVDHSAPFILVGGLVGLAVLSGVIYGNPASYLDYSGKSDNNSSGNDGTHGVLGTSTKTPSSPTPRPGTSKPAGTPVIPGTTVVSPTPTLSVVTTTKKTTPAGGPVTTPAVTVNPAPAPVQIPTPVVEPPKAPGNVPSFNPLTDTLLVPVGGSSGSIVLTTRDGSVQQWGPAVEAFSYSDGALPVDKPLSPVYLVLEYPQSTTPYMASQISVHVRAQATAVPGDKYQLSVVVGDWNSPDVYVITINVEVAP